MISKNGHVSLLITMLFAGLFLSLIIFTFGNSNLDSVSEYNIANKSTADFVERGRFLDVNGKVLAENNEFIEVAVDVNDAIHTTELEAYKASVEEDTIKYRIPYNNYQQIILDNPDLLNIFKKVSRASVRNYLYPYQFAHVIGYVGKSETSLVDQQVGKYKLEQSKEEELTKGQTYKTDKQGQLIKGTNVGGNDVQLTIDLNWQRSLYQLLEEYAHLNNTLSSAAIISNAKTGEIKAMVNYPSFDTNIISKGADADYFTQLENDPAFPLIDKTMSLSTEPGSVFKIVTAYKLLTSGVIDENSGFFSNRCMNIGNYSICEFGQNFYGYLTLQSALYKSSNLFFCNYILDFAKGNKIDSISSFTKDLGIGDGIFIDLPGLIPGRVDSTILKQQTNNEEWFDGDSCNLAIGQGRTTLTPLELLTLVNIYANRGNNIPELHVINGLVDEYGQLYPSEFGTKNIPLDTAAIDKIVSGMSEVIYNDQSAVSVYFRNLRDNNIFAKTGTAETYLIRDDNVYAGLNGWIAGGFEYNNEEYVFTILERFSKGSYYTAPILQDFIICLNSDFTADECRNR